MKGSNTSISLVNFRMSQSLLAPLDHACMLSGKTRTQVITELVQDYVFNVGSKLPDAILESDRISLNLKNAAMNVENSKSANLSGQDAIGTQSRVKRSFSSFLGQRYKAGRSK